ncbi:MAG: protein-glutamate O-methyltransferase CheR [Planctomycetota bacterium]|nr:protein-glutamate O-methyltransferase CheR [Planctomycetota bacterium]
MRTLAESQFQRIAALAQARWGLHLTPVKLPLVSSRLASFLRKSRFASPEAYLDHLETDATDEDMLLFFDLLSTNVTSFFRDPQHFAYLEREFYTPLARENLTTPGRRIRVWSAACSTGQEPYSLAINALESLPDIRAWDVRILGTDLSTFAVGQAKAGRYSPDSMDGMPPELAERYFSSVPGQSPPMLEVAPEVRKLVTIGRLNLMDAWPMRGPFDVIFCRNVMIYFNAETRRRLVRRFHDLLRPQGILAVGSAETLAGLGVPFRSVQPSVYVKE